MCQSQLCTPSCRSMSDSLTPASCRSRLRCKMRYAGHNTWPKSCACTFTTLMPIKRLLPRLLVSLNESSSTAVLQADCYVIDPCLHMSISALHPSLRLFCFLPVARLASLAVRCRMDLTHFWVVWGGGGTAVVGGGGGAACLSCHALFSLIVLA